MGGNVTAKIMIRQFAIDINSNNAGNSSQATPIAAQATEYEVYQATEAAFNIACAVCPECNADRVQKPHSRYSRWLITWEDGKRIERSVEIGRTICGDCGSTHAVLPDVIIPYMQYSLKFVIETLWEYHQRHENGKTVVAICAERGIAASTLYEWKGRFIMHLKLDADIVAAESAMMRWHPENAIESGATKEFFERHGFSFMQSKMAAPRSVATPENAVPVDAVPHTSGILIIGATDYNFCAVKNPDEMEVGYGKNDISIQDGAVEDRTDCANSAEDVCKNNNYSLLQADNCTATGAPGWREAKVRLNRDSPVNRTPHGGWAGCVDQACTEARRGEKVAFRRRINEDMRHQRAVPGIAYDTS